MSIHVALTHVTHYRYDRRVGLSPQIVRLRPAPHCRTPVHAYSLRIDPGEHFVNWQQDAFSNHLARLVFPEKTTEFKVTVDLVAELTVYNPFDFFLEPSAERCPFVYEPTVRKELAPYLETEPLTARLREFIASIRTEPRQTIDFLVALNQRLHREIAYTIRMEPGVQSPEETLALGSGSCRDSGWLLVTVLRHLGLAARFVSGYLIQLKPDVVALDGPSGAASDFTDLHAWCEVYLPGAGWVGLDPTSGLFAGEGHLPLACTPGPSSAAPVSGAVDPCEVSFEHRMEITRLLETPRVSKPYTDAQWDAVLALGESVERDLQQRDVRLTMGGEPTFVSVDDRDSPEWNTDALGPTKRMIGQSLMQRLAQRYGAGGFLHFGQGKWYPGEQLPRWALSLCWRKDGEPCWNDPHLFADEREPQQRTLDDARRFIETLAAQLGVSAAHLQPGYEDTWYYLWRERRLPANVDPHESRLDDAQERARLRRVFSAGLATPVGFALPLAPAPAQGAEPAAWTTGPWFLRDERMYLVPGDSPMGFRLPLDSLPWVGATDVPHQHPVDPFAERAPLPRARAPLHQTAAMAQNPRAARETQASTRAHSLTAHANTDRTPRAQESAHWIVRTALCVEVRDPRRANGPAAEESGSANRVLYVFMPPLSRLEDYLALLAAVESTAAALNMPVVLEGYPPPRDPRLEILQVTPDPGVIEVNIHPAADWRSLVERTEFLYEAARQSRLSTEKFMLDGRHTGTGGGNHMVLGAARPEDSPFLRRPDLLASLLRYWHNHPSLSYLFSGLFIGPTSQAPRIDEARNDQVRELEIALTEIARMQALHGSAVPPWLVDRALRNILIDVTGNTHRSEFCIDKLYSPETATGRLGLLELRAFEMPPHARMSIVQQLLLRALIARFWRTPCQAPLVRWDTGLHDRFMLSTFVRMDFEDVLREMRDAGYAFDDAWFGPHFEFRFPVIGTFGARGVSVVLRTALEPWHVMGEEASAGGTVRYVDSSLERLELIATGLVDPRHVLTVNGRTVPLQPTGRHGEYVAGVRYRAWHPASALHPSIGVHAPLTIDLVDTWMERSLGGCTYHVAHPGGRNHETFPVNGYEAEGRRRARFSPTGHTAGRVDAIVPARTREFPFLLDLRAP